MSKLPRFVPASLDGRWRRVFVPALAVAATLVTVAPLFAEADPDNTTCGCIIKAHDSHSNAEMHSEVANGCPPRHPCKCATTKDPYDKKIDSVEAYCGAVVEVP